jgi:hypothetical protein
MPLEPSEGVATTLHASVLPEAATQLCGAKAGFNGVIDARKTRINGQILRTMLIKYSKPH